jgi:histidine phosphotransferase ChpT
MTEETGATAAEELPLLSDMELAALIASRICHDLISPIGAIANGLEVLSTDSDEEMRQVAMQLIESSARQASAKLQFARLAFGAAGYAGSEMALGEAGELARKLLADDARVSLQWQAPNENRPKAVVKLALNLLLIAHSCIPRGGEIVVSADADTLVFTARGRRAALPERTASVLTGAVLADEIDAHKVQPYYTVRLLEETGHELEIDQREDEVIITARKVGGEG